MSGNDLNNTSRTNWEALESMSDEDIDYSDIPPLTDEFFEKATLRIPAAQARNLIQLDPDVMAWFQAQDTEYKTLINTVLRRYIENSGDPLQLHPSQNPNALSKATSRLIQETRVTTFRAWKIMNQQLSI